MECLRGWGGIAWRSSSLPSAFRIYLAFLDGIFFFRSCCYLRLAPMAREGGRGAALSREAPQAGLHPLFLSFPGLRGEKEGKGSPELGAGFGGEKTGGLEAVAWRKEWASQCESDSTPQSSAAQWSRRRLSCHFHQQFPPSSVT